MAAPAGRAPRAVSDQLQGDLAYYIGLYRSLKKRYDTQGDFYYLESRRNSGNYIPRIQDLIVSGIFDIDSDGNPYVSKDSLTRFRKYINIFIDQYAKSIPDDIKEYRDVDEKLPSVEDAKKELNRVIDLPADQKIELLDVIVHNQRVGGDPRLGLNLTRNRIILFREAVKNDFYKAQKATRPEAPEGPALGALIAKLEESAAGGNLEITTGNTKLSIPPLT